MKAHAEVSIRGRIEEAVRARPRVHTPFRADDVVMVWKTHPPSRRGRWVGPGVCIGSHRGSLWINMRGALWKCSRIQCKLATTEESRGLEIQKMLLDDMRADLQEFPGRRTCVDVEREGDPPPDANVPAPAADLPGDDDDENMSPQEPPPPAPPPAAQPQPEPEISQADIDSLRNALQPD
eukprot:9471461-Pyramimonas_sp.AAC.1